MEVNIFLLYDDRSFLFKSRVTRRHESTAFRLNERSALLARVEGRRVDRGRR